jgi:predicted PurR-regulated permease PerM
MSLERLAQIIGRFLVLLLGVAVFGWLVLQLTLVFVPLLLAVLLAAVITPLVNKMENWGINRLASVSIVYLLAIAGTIGVFAAIVPLFIEQARDLGPTLRDGWDSVSRWLEEGPLEWDRDRIDGLIAPITSGEIIPLSRIASGAGEVLAGALLTVVLSFFFVKDGPEISTWILLRTPVHYRATVGAAGGRMWRSFGGFMRGTAVVALVDAVGIAIGLAIIGVPLVLPLALLVFIGGFVPVIGAAITGLLAVLVALAWGGIGPAIATLVVVVIVQQVESNVLQPMVMRRSVALHPVVVLAVLTAGATTIGIVGALLAVPVTAAVVAAGNEIRIRSENGMLRVEFEEVVDGPHHPLAPDLTGDGPEDR